MGSELEEIAKRIDKVETEGRTNSDTLIRMGVIIEQLSDILPTLTELDKRISKNEYNWGIVKWVIGPSAFGAFGLFALRFFGLI